MEYLIKYIIELTDEIYFNNVPTALDIYLRGGCYDLARILKMLVPDSTICVDDMVKHSIVEQDGSFYDATGLINEGIDNYHIANEEELYILEKYSKESVKGLHLYQVLGPKLAEIGVENIIKEQIRKDLEDKTRKVA